MQPTADQLAKIEEIAFFMAAGGSLQNEPEVIDKARRYLELEQWNIQHAKTRILADILGNYGRICAGLRPELSIDK